MSDKKKLHGWLWLLGLAVAGLGATAAALFRGCWHTRMCWPIRHDEHHSYRVCTSCGVKRLFDHENFREYGPYGYDLDELIARTRARNIKRIHQATAKTGQPAKKHEEKRAG